MLSIKSPGWEHRGISLIASLINPSSARLVSAFKSISKALSLLVAFIGFLELIGWAFDIARMKSVAAGLVTMKANAALGFVLTGASLWFLSRQDGRRFRLVPQSLAAAAALLGLLTLAEYLLAGNFGIDELLFRESADAAETYSPGRMSPIAAFNFALIGIALLILHRGFHWLAQVFAITATFVSMLALAGYVYGVESLYRIAPHWAMPIHTTIAFIMLGAGTLFALANRGMMAVITSDSSGGMMARRLLPSVLLLPMAVGWVRLLGERAGLYSTEFGLVIMVSFVIVGLGSLILWNVASLHRSDLARRRAEEALRESEARYQDLYENAPDAYISVDAAAATIIQCNNTLSKVTGYSKEEILGRPVFEMYHPDCLEDAKRAFNRLVATGEVRNAELQLSRKDGSKIDVILNASAVRDEKGKILYGRSSLRDITDLKQAEQSLRAVERRYRDLFENANDIIYTIDLDGKFTAVNKAAERLTGYSRDETAGMSISQIVAPEYLELARKNLFNKTMGHTESTIYEVEIICKDGNRLPVEVSSRLISEEGEPVGVQGIARDLSERKHFEEQLRQSQKMEAIGRLAGGIAHDFNNLLTAILGYSKIARAQLRKDDPICSSIEEIERAGEKAASLTRQLLAFSRKQVLRPELLNLNEVIANLKKMLDRLIGEDIEIIAKLDPQLGRIKADPGQIEQVIMNLAVNARDAMPRGGKLTIETANVYLDESGVEAHSDIGPGSYVMLAVSDSGLGMDRETLLHIFEPFFTTKDVGKGTGLGLSTVYGIVKQSGGGILVNSETGGGTTFRVYLPRVEESPETTESLAPFAESVRGEGTVLVVEDEESVRRLTRRILEANGYTVLEAGNAKDALAICERRAEPIDLLITDVVMPGMSGRELAQEIMKLHPTVKSLYMSGYTDDAIVHHGVLDPDVVFLQKPFSPETLMSKVREALNV